MVILIDEASNLKDDDWRNSFYGQLRAIANDRAIAKDGDIARRLRFVFAGTFRPESLLVSQSMKPEPQMPPTYASLCVRGQTSSHTTVLALSLRLLSVRPALFQVPALTQVNAPVLSSEPDVPCSTV